jgi:hypothetical protein
MLRENQSYSSGLGIKQRFEGLAPMPIAIEVGPTRPGSVTSWKSVATKCW